jgi:hypothetical protein
MYIRTFAVTVQYNNTILGPVVRIFENLGTADSGCALVNTELQFRQGR